MGTGGVQSLSLYKMAETQNIIYKSPFGTNLFAASIPGGLLVGETEFINYSINFLPGKYVNVPFYLVAELVEFLTNFAKKISGVTERNPNDLNLPNNKLLKVEGNKLLHCCHDQEEFCLIFDNHTLLLLINAIKCVLLGCNMPSEEQLSAAIKMIDVLCHEGKPFPDVLSLEKDQELLTYSVNHLQVPVRSHTKQYLIQNSELLSSLYQLTRMSKS